MTTHGFSTESDWPDIHTELMWAEQDVEHGHLKDVLEDMKTNYQFSKKYTHNLHVRRKKLESIYEASRLSIKESLSLISGTEIFKWRRILINFLTKDADLSEVSGFEREKFMDGKLEHLTNAVYNALHEIPVSEEQMQTYEEFVDIYKTIVQYWWGTGKN